MPRSELSRATAGYRSARERNISRKTTLTDLDSPQARRIGDPLFINRSDGSSPPENRIGNTIRRFCTNFLHYRQFCHLQLGTFNTKRNQLAPMRRIFLDTETTGLDHRTGDRVIEIGCIEVYDRRRTLIGFQQ